MRPIVLTLAVALLAASAGAKDLPEGGATGHTPLVKDPDVMALLIKKDKSKEGIWYAVLSEYTRLKHIPGPERLEVTRWVPRMHAYRVEKISDVRYAMRPLHVSAAGEIEPDGQYVPSALQLKEAGTLKGATLTRFDKGSNLFSETITFDGSLGSTWENFVVGNFFWSRDPTGGDYLKKGINTTLSDDHVADFRTEKISGSFQMTEKVPGFWTLKAKNGKAVGADKIEDRIGVFIDIVNWKPLFTTNELLLINPDDPRDVGFFYQRH